MHGKVIAGERFKVVVKFFPGVPDNIDEMFLVECGHFPAVRFKVKAVGIYPGCLLSFPRVPDEEFTGRLQQAKDKFDNAAVTYNAPFKAEAAAHQMPTIPPKMVEKEKVMIKEQNYASMEIEVEADRTLLCEKIVQKLNQS